MEAGRPQKGGSSPSHSPEESNIILKHTQKHTTPPVTSPACKKPASAMRSKDGGAGEGRKRGMSRQEAGEEVGLRREARSWTGANEGQKKKRRRRKDVRETETVLRMKGSKGSEGVNREKAN